MELLEKKEAQAMEDSRQPWMDIDIEKCRRLGPSYRALPANVIFLTMFSQIILLASG